MLWFPAHSISKNVSELKFFSIIYFSSEYRTAKIFLKVSFVTIIEWGCQLNCLFLNITPYFYFQYLTIQKFHFFNSIMIFSDIVIFLTNPVGIKSAHWKKLFFLQTVFVSTVALPATLMVFCWSASQIIIYVTTVVPGSGHCATYAKWLRLATFVANTPHKNRGTFVLLFVIKKSGMNR